MTFDLLEGLGYLASVLVAVSLMMTSVVRLRLINLAGSILFAVYGVLIDAIPVAALNALIAVVNVVFLVRISRREEAFSILAVDHDSAYLARFVEHHRDDILRYMPDFRIDEPGETVSVFVLRDLVPAGLFIAEPAGGSVMRVRLDYAIPAYRDLRIGRFLYRRLPGLLHTGPIRLVTPAGAPAHDRYLERMGYRREDGDYVLILP